jgi:chlorophyll(ide) b reductase
MPAKQPHSSTLYDSLALHEVEELNRKGGAKGLFNPSQALAILFLAWNPVISLNPSSPRSLSTARSGYARAHPVANVVNENDPSWQPITQEEKEAVVAKSSGAEAGSFSFDSIVDNLPGPLQDILGAVDVDNMEPRGVVITGGANGVGFAYASSFMKRGHSVVICDIKDPAEAVAILQERHGGGSGKIYGCVCDVSSAESVEKFGEFAKESLGTIHYWINNAGINGGRRPFTSLSTQTVEAVVKVNLIGVLLCTKVAMDIMQKQAGVTSHLFNTVGSGVKGGGTPGYVTYGATKRGLPQMTASLVAELTKGVPGFPVPKPEGTVNVHTLSPGMVFTKLLLDDSTPELRKFPFGVLAAQPEEVGEDLVPKILATRGNGKLVEFLDTKRVLRRFKEKFIDKVPSEFIDDDGNVIKTPGEEYDAIGVRKLY